MSDFTMTNSGEAVPTEKTFSVINPSTGEAHAEAPDASKEQLDAAFDSSAKAYRDWKLDEGARRDALRAAAGVLMASAGELAPVLTAEQGKPIGDANIEVFGAGIWFQYFADLDMPREVI
jgi:acyl-CoA reductase-like NAD-dependent aldehyde dehydrogenase